MVKNNRGEGTKNAFHKMNNVFKRENDMYNKLFEEVIKESKLKGLLIPLREMSRLGKFGELSVGEKNSAFYADSDEIESNPIIPQEFENLQKIIPESDWWWISSGFDSHNEKKSTQGTGSFEFRFTSKSFFHFICKYDPFVGFTKIEFSYDDIDVKVKNPNLITIKKMEEIVQYNYSEMWNFALVNCDLDEFKKQRIQKIN